MDMRAKSWVPDAYQATPDDGVDPWGKAADAFENQTIPIGEFYNDPVGFVDEFIDFEKAARNKKKSTPGLTEYQREILALVPAKKRVAVRGPHGLGKTTTNALTVLWFAITRDDAGVDWKVATTAGAWRQLEKYLWPEIAKWARCLRWDRLGIEPWRKGKELMTLSLSLTYGEAFAVASSDKQKIEGVHADSVLYIFDESKAIAADIFDAAEGAFSGALSVEELEAMSEAEARETLEALAVATSTPGEPSGRFYDIHSHKEGFEDWHTRHVKLAEVIKAGRISEHWARQRGKMWGTDSALYANRVLGEFHSSADDAVIPLSWVEAANERWHEWQRAGRRKHSESMVLGVDVALGGADKTAVARRRGVVIESVERLVTADTLQVAAAVQVRLTPADHAVIDVIGVGAGVYDTLKKEGVSVRPFTASKKSFRRDRSGDLGFINRRAELWWGMRERLDPAFNSEVCLPPDDELTAELVTPKWWVTAGNKIQVESKQDIHKRIGRSTDTADGVLQTWASAESQDDDEMARAAQGGHLGQAVKFATPADLDDYMPGGGHTADATGAFFPFTEERF